MKCAVGTLKSILSIAGPQPLGGELDERRMERPRDLEPDRAARAFALRLVAALVDGIASRPRRRAGRGSCSSPARRCGSSGRAPRPPHRRGPRIAAIEPGRSLAAAAVARPRSRTSAIVSAIPSERGRAESRELADRVADHVVGLDPARTQRRVDREARRDERRLLELGPASAPRSLPSKQSRFRSSPEASLPSLVDRHRLRFVPRRSPGPCRARTSPGRGT